jgi:hypothetical protein
LTRRWYGDRQKKRPKVHNEAYRKYINMMNISKIQKLSCSFVYTQSSPSIKVKK